MDCHRCPYREKIEAGEFAQAAFDETPCAKCELMENSDRTMEFDQERAGKGSAFRVQESAFRMGNDRPQTSDIRHLTEEEQLPLSLMNEVVFRLLSMTPETRDVLCWRFAGMPYRDIAVLQGVTVAAVEKRHWKAMKKWPALRAMFAMKVAKHGKRKSVGSGQNTVDRKDNSKGKRRAL